MTKQLIFLTCILATKMLCAGDSEYLPNEGINNKYLKYGESSGDDEKEERPNFNMADQEPNIAEIPIKSKANTGRKESKKNIRSRLSSEAVALLNWWFDNNWDNAYPNEEEKEQLANEAGLTLSQVNNWFTNKRRRNEAYTQYVKFGLGNKPSFAVKPYIKDMGQASSLNAVKNTPNLKFKEQLSKENRKILVNSSPKNPLPTGEKKERPAKKINVSITKNNNGFTNKRRRDPVFQEKLNMENDDSSSESTEPLTKRRRKNQIEKTEIKKAQKNDAEEKRQQEIGHGSVPGISFDFDKFEPTGCEMEYHHYTMDDFIYDEEIKFSQSFPSYGKYKF